MYKIGDTVLYGREGVCKIKDIVTRKLNNIDKQYYFLTPLDDHITILVPTDNEEALSKMRKVLSKKDIYELIKTMNHEQLVKLTKTLYLNKQKQEKAGKKFHVQDQHFLQTAEKMLYDEFCHTLNLKPEQILPFILETLKEN